MKTIHCAALLLLAARTAMSDAAVSDYVPPPDFEPGWRTDFAPEIYTAENLYEYIDGEAELYIDYDFVEMVTTSYAREGDESATFTLDLYDMGSPLHAFGIYSSYRRPELDTAPIGREATVSDLNIRFYKGKYFAQLNAGSTDAVVVNALLTFARRLAASLPDAEAPLEISLLPAEARIPRSLKYITRGFFGQTLFRRTLSAEYELPSGTCTAFLVLFDDQASARQAMNDFAASIRERGQVLEGDAAGFVAQTPYHGRITARQQGAFIMGVSDAPEGENVEELLDRMKRRIQP